MNELRGAQGFLAWVKKRTPFLYEKIKDKLPRVNLAGLGVDINETQLVAMTTDPSKYVAQPTLTTPATSGWSETIQSLLKTAAIGYQTTQQRKNYDQIVNANIRAAQAGLPVYDYDVSGLFSPRVNVGMSDDTKKLFTTVGVAVLMIGVVMWGVVQTGKRQTRGH